MIALELIAFGAPVLAVGVFCWRRANPTYFTRLVNDLKRPEGTPISPPPKRGAVELVLDSVGILCIVVGATIVAAGFTDMVVGK